MDLAERVHKIEQDIVKIKAIQNTQNDSYQFYAYQSSNLYGQTWNTIEIEFKPFKANKEDVICNFFACGGQIVQYIELVNVDPVDPCKAKFQTASNWINELPDWTKYFYVSCYSNCKGELLVSLV